MHITVTLSYNSFTNLAKLILSTVINWFINATCFTYDHNIRVKITAVSAATHRLKIIKENTPCNIMCSTDMPRCKAGLFLHDVPTNTLITKIKNLSYLHKCLSL